MLFDYVYKIHTIDSSGVATVEYKNDKLGSVTRVFFVPYADNESVVHRVIKENFPYSLFYSRYLTRTKAVIPESVANLSGRFSTSFEDYFYDVNVEVIAQNEEKSS